MWARVRTYSDKYRVDEGDLQGTSPLEICFHPLLELSQHAWKQFMQVL